MLFIKFSATLPTLAVTSLSLLVGLVNASLKKFFIASHAGSTNAVRLKVFNFSEASSNPNFSAKNAGILINNKSIASVKPLMTPFIPPSNPDFNFSSRSPLSLVKPS